MTSVHSIAPTPLVRDRPFPVECSGPPCQVSVDHICVGLFLGFRFCSTGLCVCGCQHPTVLIVISFVMPIYALKVLLEFCYDNVRDIISLILHRSQVRIRKLKFLVSWGEEEECGKWEGGRRGGGGWKWGESRGGPRSAAASRQRWVRCGGFMPPP